MKEKEACLMVWQWRRGCCNAGVVTESPGLAEGSVGVRVVDVVVWCCGGLHGW